jgi:competence ComEA-like helix-hairpin-helix protein
MKKQNNKHKYIIHATGIAGILILLFIRIFSVQISNRNSISPEQQKSVFAPYNQESPAGTDNKPRPQQHNAPASQRSLPATRPNAPETRQNAPETRQNASSGNPPARQSTTEHSPAAHTPMKVELNTADSAELVKLYGIGPYYAQKILEYRERLGGFAIPEQLLEIKGFDKDRLDGFYDRVFADTSFIRKINLKTASENQLANHLYIGRYLARCIIRYRDTADPDSCSVEHLVRHGILTQEQGQKIGWYLR